MPDGQQATPAETPAPTFNGRPLESLEDLGLSEEDLEGFGEDQPRGELGELEDQQPVQEGTTAPAVDPGQPASPAQPTQPTPAAAPTRPSAAATPPAPSGASETAQPAAAAPAAQVEAQPSPEAPATKPWTPTADGQKLEIDGATVEADGSLRIPAASLAKLQQHLAYRPHISRRFEQLQEQLRQSAPDKNEDVILARRLIREFAEANGKGEDGLWDFVQRLGTNLPAWAALARAESLTHRIHTTEQRDQSAQAEAAWQEMEPRVRAGLDGEIDAFLQDPALADLRPLRDTIAEQFWNARDRYLAIADKDYPEHGLVRGQPFVRIRELRQALEERLAVARAARHGVTRDAADRRNAAVLAGPAKVPPVPSQAPAQLTTRATDDGMDPNRPKTKEEWQDRLRQIANSPD